MKIQLESWHIVDLAFNALEKPRQDDDSKNSFSLKTGQHFPAEEKNKFSVFFDASIADSHFDLSLKAFFIFNTDSPVDEHFKISDFPKINAPAIAFPYLRAYISNLTLQSGYEPVILPSINFVQLAQEGNE